MPLFDSTTCAGCCAAWSLPRGWIRGSHHVFRKAGVPERINPQRDGAHAKPYQVRQVRQTLLKHELGGEE